MATRVTPIDHDLDSGSGTSLSTANQSVQAGDFFQIGCSWESGTTTCTVSDNKGNTYSKYPDPNPVVHGNGSLCAQMFYAVANGTYSDMVVTMTLSSARDWRRINLLYYRPTSASLSFDNGSSASGSSGSPASGSYAINSAGGAASVYIAPFSSVTYTAGAGWTEQIDDESYSEDRLTNGSEGTINGQATCSSMDWIAISIHAKEASGGGAVYVGPLTFQRMNTLLRM